MEIVIEERALGGPDYQRDKHLGWSRSAAIQPVVAPGPLAPGVLWSGTVLVPTHADMERRIVIKEFEFFSANDPPPGQAWLGESASGPNRRLVYADVIPVQ